jgi:hypothetical protein
VSAACPADVPRSANSGATCDRATNDPPGTGTGVCKAAGLPGPYACF